VQEPQFHLERDRAESFGSVAQQYERYRPPFPDALFADLAGTRVLDVGSGTGKVARALAVRGLPVLGVEIDPRMAEVARALGATIEVAKFEDWDDAGRRFDLVTCGDAWHWIDPARGAAKVAQVLEPGGLFVWFFNLQTLDEDVMQRLDVVYREHAPNVQVYGRTPPREAFEPRPLAGPFTPDEVRTYTWERRATAAEWASFCGTISDHQRLTAEQRARLLDAIRIAIGDPVTVHGRTTAHVHRRLP
jgi:SAM-dependent methyltransferase